MNRSGERPTRVVFFVSDWTGITAETVGHSLLTQFRGVDFLPVTVPFVGSAEQARELAEHIDGTAREEGCRPLVFSTLVTAETRAIVKAADCLYLDLFDAFIEPLEQELKVESSHATGYARASHASATYTHRIEPMNFALASDDGVNPTQLPRAEVILIGVSRTGKTPTCLYLALRYGVFAANYPLTEDDLERGVLPAALLKHKDRLFGLTIEPERLQSLRSERRPRSRYASARQVRYEVQEAEMLMDRHAIPRLDVTHYSVEEIAATVLHVRGLRRRFHRYVEDRP